MSKFNPSIDYIPYDAVLTMENPDGTSEVTGWAWEARRGYNTLKAVLQKEDYKPEIVFSDEDGIYEVVTVRIAHPRAFDVQQTLDAMGFGE